MKFRFFPQSLFIIFLFLLLADSRGLITDKEWQNPKSSENLVQDPHVLFRNIELYEDAPQDIPDLEFESMDGNSVSLNGLKGHYVLLNAWATWCAPCVEELPSLNNLKSMIEGEGWSVLAASIDFNVSAAEIDDFVRKHDVTDVAGYLDFSGQFQDMVMQVGGVPVTYIISPQGKILARVNGSVAWDSPPIVAFLRGMPKQQ